MSIYILLNVLNRLPRWLSGKEPTCQCKRHGFDPSVRKIPWRKRWQPTPVGNFCFYFNWRLITLQYCGGFCHMFTWENTTETCIIICETDHQSRFDVWGRVLRAGALGWPWEMGWGGRWKGGSGWGIHGLPWQIQWGNSCLGNPWAVEPSRLESAESQNSQALFSD